jgi:diguanylate cyclase (GGDEF)-like protein
MRILLVEDDELVVRQLAEVLASQHYVVDCAEDGQAGWDLLETVDYDLVLLDIRLPKLDGITLCQRLRKRGKQTPILLLTALEGTTSKVIGLDAGADDYLTKPFDFDELLARVRALLRRGSPALPPILSWQNVKLDPSTCEVTCGDEILRLTPKEYGLFELFLRNPHRIFSCSALIDHQWALEDPPTDETVRSHLKGLRQKLKLAGVTGDPIETVYGIGYRLKSEPSPDPKHSSKTEPPAVGPVQFVGSADSDLSRGVTEVWQQVQDKLRGRVAVLETASQALMTAQLSETQRQTAVQEAHKLVGSLGMFGSEEGSRIAQSIEELFQGSQVRNRQQTATLKRLVQALQQELQNINLSPQASQDVLPRGQDALPQTPIAKIMIVDDDPLLLMALQKLLTPWGLEVLTLDDPRQCLAVLATQTPDLLILDVKMPHKTGIELCQQVREMTQWSDLPILFLTANANAKAMEQVYEAGADDYVRKPVAGPELITRILNRLERSRLSKSLIELDTLTRVANRRQSTEELLQAIDESDRTQQPFSLAIVDLDQLKQINRQYGHAAGDQVLSHLGSLLRNRFQKENVIGRWGGTEFVIGMVNTSIKTGVKHLSEILQKLREIEFQGLRNTLFQATFSAVVVGYPQAGNNLESLYWAADAILQTAKSTGGNCILPYPKSSSSIKATLVRE